ncbi:MAG: PH domain-containing protein [Nitrosopumilus sp.]|nr:PH domain-containing protein [Nitrosopumilus sp.]
MPLRDYLVPEEQIKFICKRDIEYANKKYFLAITNKRILLYKERGILNKSEDIVCEKLERLGGLEYKEKRGLLFSLAKISITGGIKIDIKGPSEEVKSMFQVLEGLINLK